MAMINPCTPGNVVANTGSECDEAMLYTKQIWFMDPSVKWTATDLLDFTTFLNTKRHANGSSRFTPVFGSGLPVRGITDSNEADVLETFEDGTKRKVRYGMFERTFMTDKGGLCYAQNLMKLGSRLAFIEVDENQKVLMMQNLDGTYSGVPTNLSYSPVPELANLKTVYKNKLLINFNPLDYITKGKIVKGDATEDILSLQGLIESIVYRAATETNSGSTPATGGYTIVKGATNDTIDVQVSGKSISGGPVVQTVSESTDTLLATKVKNAINAATATNGGYSAANTAGALTITAPAGLGATINTVQATAVIVGTITTTTPLAFSGGVTGTLVLKLGVKTECAETDLIAKYGTTLVTATNFVIYNSAGVAVSISAASIVSGIANISIPYLSGKYTLGLAPSATLFAAGIIGYDCNDKQTITVS